MSDGHRTVTAIFREPEENRATQEAYEELRTWAIDSLSPIAGKLVRQKVKELSSQYGVKEGAILRMLMAPPGREPHKEVIDYLYKVVFSR